MGISLVKSVLRVPGTNGKTRIFFAPDLENGLPKKQNGEEQESIFDEFELYHKKTDKAGRVLDMDDPAKEFDHFLDSIRYLIYWLVGRSRGSVNFTDDMMSHSPQAKMTERKTNVPTNRELLHSQGIAFIDNSDVPEVDNDGRGEVPEPGGAIWKWS
jgi:hypothetical protein